MSFTDNTSHYLFEILPTHLHLVYGKFEVSMKWMILYLYHIQFLIIFSKHDLQISSLNYTYFLSESKNCKTCDRILSSLETRNVELEEAGIKLVKLNDKKAAKTYGVLSSPGLTYFKGIQLFVENPI